MVMAGQLVQHPGPHKGNALYSKTSMAQTLMAHSPGLASLGSSLIIFSSFFIFLFLGQKCQPGEL